MPDKKIDLKNITFNGVPLEIIIDEEIREEIRSNHQKEVVSLGFVVARSRTHSTSVFRNHSGARTSRGRVIFSAGGAQ